MNTLQKLTYGHYIVTALKKADELKTRNEDYIAAASINWASQISFEPEMVMISVSQSSDLNETIDYSGSFTLHLLSTDQKGLVEKFASENKVEGDKINGISFRKENDELLLDKALGYVSCKVEKSENMGDHTLYFGKVISKNLNENVEPLCTNNLKSQYSKENR